MKKTIILLGMLVCFITMTIISHTTKANQSEWLNMTTVIGYETTESGVLLYTDDGNGYFIER